MVFEPATLAIKIQVTPAEQNRAIVLSLNGDDYFRSSDLPLQGLAGPKTSWVTFPRVPAGSYTLSAIVLDAGNHMLERKDQTVFVIPRN